MSLLATSKNIVVVFNSPIISIPHVFTGFSNTGILQIPDVDIVKSTMGCDGYINRAVIATLLKGSFDLWPASPSLGFIQSYQNLVNETGFTAGGTLTVTFPSLATIFTYTDFAFESGAKGLEAAEEAKPVKINWSSQLPNRSSLGTAIALATEFSGAF